MNIMRVWITSKKVLDEGIIETDAFEIGETGIIQTTDENPKFYEREGKDWHRTMESAVKRAEDMRIRKIKLLKKYMDKYKGIKFK